mmetsp:Transcript_11276/g.17255  ORF Transcript_11276/g.17255 Transcript_11276/m.17255 type:complete len:225 (-) Transcript_11276:685-1359(-)
MCNFLCCCCCSSPSSINECVCVCKFVCFDCMHACISLQVVACFSLVFNFDTIFVTIGWCSHSNEFFGRGWMNSNGIVKILLGGTHFNRNSNALHHFSCIICSNMTSNNLLCLCFNNEFKECSSVADFGKGMFHGFKGSLVNGDILECFHRFLFCVSHGCNFWIGKDGRCDKCMIDGSIHSTKQGIGETMSFHQGDRCQCHAIRHVAHGINVIDRCLGIVIDGKK